MNEIQEAPAEATDTADGVVSDSPAHRYDAAARRKGQRRQKGERGIWVYIPRDELRTAGAPTDGSPVYYRVWGTPRGGAFLRFYATP